MAFDPTMGGMFTNWGTPQTQTYRYPGAATSSPYQATAGGTTGTSGQNSSNNSTSTNVTNYATSPFATLQPALQSGAQAGLSAGASALNTAADPQNELRAREEQRLQDSARVNAAARGITSSPYGAGVENKAMSDFGIDWQNTQLGRQAQGVNINNSALGAAQGLYGMGGTTTNNTSGTSSTSGYQTNPPPDSTSGGSRTGAGGAKPAAGSGLLPFPSGGVPSYQDVLGLSPTMNGAPSGETGYTQPGISAPGWTSPVGGVQTPQGVGYNQYVDPSAYPMASPAQVMGGMTGSNWGSPDTTTVGGTGGASYQDLMSGGNTNALGQPIVDMGMGTVDFSGVQMPTNDAEAQALLDMYF